MDAVERALQALPPPGIACPMQAHRPTPLKALSRYGSLQVLLRRSVVSTTRAGVFPAGRIAGPVEHYLTPKKYPVNALKERRARCRPQTPG